MAAPDDPPDVASVKVYVLDPMVSVWVPAG
jgi:hypothetical protein